MSVTTSETTYTWDLIKLECPTCARSCQERLQEMQGIKDAQLTYATATLTVVFEPGIDEERAHMDVLNVVRDTHQDLALNEIQRRALGLDAPHQSAAEHIRHLLYEKRDLLLLVVSALCIVVGIILNEPQADIAFIAGALVGLCSILPAAGASLRRVRIDMNVLMSIAVVGALVLRAYEEAALVIFLNQIGELLESYSMVKTRNSIKTLMALAPEIAHVRAGETWKDVAISNLALGSTIQVRAGERVPLDARIVEGSSALDESIITGESVAVDKCVGDIVYGGSLNTSGVLVATTIAREQDSTVKRIVALVQQAQAQKAPYEEFVHRFAAIYTPVVVLAASAVALFPPIFSALGIVDAQAWSTWAYRALTLLVISCPCALVISTPVSFVSALTRAAKDGILVKGGAFFDVATHLKAIAFDKTGTLTVGRPQVAEILPLRDGVDELQLLLWMASIEAQSNHPLARALCTAYHQASSQPLLQAMDVVEVAGAGAQGYIGNKLVMVGKPAYVLEELQEHGQLSLQDSEQILAQIKQVQSGAAVVMVAVAGVVQGVAFISDELRAQAPQAVADLMRLEQFEAVEMLTGDHRDAARCIADQAGIKAYQADLRPADKITHVSMLQEQVGPVAFVGDGVNDAPALAQADIGITMGAAASDTALEVADVALLNEDLGQIPHFVRLAHKTMHVVRENIVLAIAVKVIFFVLAIAGVATMWMAIFADTGIALLVILNGMRLMVPSDFRW